jgi:hypothetical protein
MAKCASERHLQGKAGARRLYCEWFRNLFTKGHNGPIHGFLLDHLQMQDIVDICADGRTASGRFRALLLAGQHESKKERIEHFPEQCWEAGIYENQYVKDRGIWKIKRLDYTMLWQADYAPGWAKSGVHLPPLTKLFPADRAGRTSCCAAVPNTWPNTRVVPFHYPHPVTGRPGRRVRISAISDMLIISGIAYKLLISSGGDISGLSHQDPGTARLRHQGLPGRAGHDAIRARREVRACAERHL